MYHPNAILRWLRDSEDQIVADLREFIAVETPSDDLAALERGMAWLQDRIASRLSSPNNRVDIFEDGTFGPVAVYEFPGRGDAKNLRVTALCHYDTVWQLGTLAGWEVIERDDVISGPGAFDMKAGLIQCIWAVAAIDHLELPRPTITLIITGDEEIGSPASRPIIEEYASASDYVLVFEASADGAIKTERKGAGTFTIEVLGIESHAGLDPDAGVSAVDELSRLIVRLHDAEDRAQGTTINVGVIEGGSRINVKAGRATAGVDIRVASEAERTRIDAFLRELAPVHPKAKLSVTGSWDRPVMARSAAGAEMFARARQVGSELGLTLEQAAVGGYSDGNIVAALGIPVLDGLGAVGGGAHARDEWVSVSALAERAALAAGLIVELGRSWTDPAAN